MGPQCVVATVTIPLLKVFFHVLEDIVLQQPENI